jgi:hypothetical protein
VNVEVLSLAESGVAQNQVIKSQRSRNRWLPEFSASKRLPSGGVFVPLQVAGSVSKISVYQANEIHFHFVPVL